MELKCISAFGNHKPGDVVTIPDGAEFNHWYFEVEKESVPASKKNDKPGANAGTEGDA